MRKFVSYLIITVFFVQNVLANVIVDTFEGWRMELGNQVVGHSPGQLGEAYKKIFDALRTGKAGTFDGFIDRYASDSEETAIIKAAMLRGIFDFQSDDLGGKNVIKHTDVVDDDHRLDWITKAETIALGFKYYGYQSEDSKQHTDKVKLHNYIVDAYLLAGRELWRHFGGWYNEDKAFGTTLAAKNDFLDNFINQFSDKLKGYGIESPEEFVDFKNLKKYFYQIIKENKGLLLLFTDRYNYIHNKENAKKKLGVSQVKVYGNKRNFVNDRQAKDAFILGLYDENFQRTKQNDQAVNAAYGKGQLTDATNIIDIVNDIYAAAQVRQSYNYYEAYKNSEEKYYRDQYSEHRKVVRSITKVPELVRIELLSKLKGINAFRRITFLSSIVEIMDRVNTLIGSGNEESKIQNARALIDAINVSSKEIAKVLVYNSKHGIEALKNYMELLSLIKDDDYQEIKQGVVKSFNSFSPNFKVIKDKMLHLSKLAREKIGKKSKLLILYGVLPNVINLSSRDIARVSAAAKNYDSKHVEKLEKLTKKLTLKSITEYKGEVISKLVKLAKKIPEEVINELLEKEYKYDTYLLNVINQINAHIDVYSIPQQIFLARVAQFNPASTKYFVDEVKETIASMNDSEVFALKNTMSNHKKFSSTEYIKQMAKLHKFVGGTALYSSLETLLDNIDDRSSYELSTIADVISEYDEKEIDNLIMLGEKIKHDPSVENITSLRYIIEQAKNIDRKVIEELAEPGINLEFLRKVSITDERLRPTVIFAIKKRPALKDYVEKIKLLLFNHTNDDLELFKKVIKDSAENASYEDIKKRYIETRIGILFSENMQEFSDAERELVFKSGAPGAFAKLRGNFSSYSFTRFKELLIQARDVYGNLKDPIDIINSLRPRKDDPDRFVQAAEYAVNQLSKFKDNVKDITGLIDYVNVDGAYFKKESDFESLKKSLDRYVTFSKTRKENIIKALEASKSLRNSLSDISILTTGNDDIGQRISKIFDYLIEDQRKISGFTNKRYMTEISQEQYEAAIKLLDDKNFRETFFHVYDYDKKEKTTDHISNEVLKRLMDNKWAVKNHEALREFLGKFKFDHKYKKGGRDHNRKLATILRQVMVAATAMKDSQDNQVFNLYEPLSKFWEAKGLNGEKINLSDLPKEYDNWGWDLSLEDSMYVGSNEDRKLIVNMLEKHFTKSDQINFLAYIVQGFAVMLEKGTDSEEISETVAAIDKVLSENNEKAMQKKRKIVVKVMENQNFDYSDGLDDLLKKAGLVIKPYQIFNLLAEIPLHTFDEIPGWLDVKTLLERENVTFEKKQAIIQKLGSKYDSWKVYEFAFNNEYEKMSAEIEENKQRRKRMVMDIRGFESRQRIVKKLEVTSYNDYGKHYINLTGLQTLDDELPADAHAAEVAINNFMKYFREQAVRDYVRKETFKGADVSSGDIKDAFEEDVKEVLADLKLYVVKPGADIPERFVEKGGKKEPRKIDKEQIELFFYNYFNPSRMTRALRQKVRDPKDFANLVLWQGNANLASQSGNKNEAMKYQTMIASLTKNKNIRPEILLQFMAKDKSAIAEKIKQLESEIADLEKKKSTVDPNNLKLLNKQRELRRAKGDAKKQADIQKEIDEIIGDGKIKEKQKLLEELKDPKSTYTSRVLIESNNLGEYFKVDEDAGLIELIYKEGMQAVLREMRYLAE